jgi:hypothetical protein
VSGNLPLQLFDLVAIPVAFGFRLIAPDTPDPFIRLKTEGARRSGDGFCEDRLSRAGQAADQM